MAMKIFVTGATGVVGRRTVPLLIAAQHDVTAVARSPEKAAALQAAGARTIDLDLFDAAAVSRAIAGHETIINLATHIPPSSLAALLPGAWAENDRIRRTASANLVNAAIAEGATRFIQESFAPVYPDRGDDWVDEATPIEPVSYNRTIADAERAADYFSSSGRTGVILRFAAFYGPDATQLRDLIRVVRMGWAPIPSRPEAFISSVAHDDAASAVAAVLEAKPGVYNVADNEPLRRRAFFDSLAHELGVAPPQIPPAWVAHAFGSLGQLLARSQRISNRKLREATGWTPEYPSVREGWPAALGAMHDHDGDGRTRRGDDAERPTAPAHHA
jgi:nucleoside-diphosphate-sugar epimerase